MSERGSTARSGGVTFPGLLTVLFVGLKLTHHIDWSWWWVVSPIWIGFGVIMAWIVIILVVAGIAGLLDWR